MKTPITNIPEAVAAMKADNDLERLKQMGRRFRLGLRAEVEHAKKHVAEGAPLHRVVRALSWHGLPFERAMQIFARRTA